jgi:hypothetical protein
MFHHEIWNNLFFVFFFELQPIQLSLKVIFQASFFRPFFYKKLYKDSFFWFVDLDGKFTYRLIDCHTRDNINSCAT